MGILGQNESAKLSIFGVFEAGFQVKNLLSRPKGMALPQILQISQRNLVPMTLHPLMKVISF